MAVSDENIVGAPPLTTPIVDGSGILSRSWSIWFRDLYRRTAYKGGNAIDDNKSEIDNTIIDIDSTLNDVIEQVLININNIAVNSNDILQNANDLGDHEALEEAHGSNGNIVGFNDLATELAVGLVKQMALIADATDATESTVSVDSPDATTAPATYNQAQVESIVTLANETKADVNQLVSDLNTVVGEINGIVSLFNELLTNSKNSGQMNNV
jgi:hypothetical protein